MIEHPSRRRFLGAGAGLAATLAFGPARALARDDPRARAQSINNLKQIVLALHNHHDRTNAFPAPAIADAGGKPLLSWRVAILPYLEEGDLYRQFKLDEPWDSPHNKALVAKMPRPYGPTPGSKAEAGHTYYQAFVGPGAAFEAGKTLGLAEFRDGTLNTLLVAEAAEPVVWTKPDDLAFDPDGDLPKLGGLFDRGSHAALTDGSVLLIRKDAPADELKKAITRGGGEVIDMSKIRG